MMKIYMLKRRARVAWLESSTLVCTPQLFGAHIIEPILNLAGSLSGLLSGSQPIVVE
jgi:hypothetical protein